MQGESKIHELPAASGLGNLDLIPIEQNGLAKKLQGADLLQYIDTNILSASTTVIPPDQDPSAVYDPVSGALVFYLPSTDEIVSISKTATSGLVDTWTCTTALGHTFSFTVTNGGGSPAAATPLMDGTAAVGVAEKWAREDHVHPSDASRLALAGNQYLVNPVDDLNNYATGFALFNNTSSTPIGSFPYDSSVTSWALVISGKADSGTVAQVAFNLLGGTPPRVRNCASGIWSAWTDVTALADSGWTEVTFTADFKNYGTTNKCQYRKVGNVVTVCGAATPVNDIAGSNTQHTMFTLPSGYRPKVALSSIQQGSGNARWQLQVSTNGGVSFSRYADENGLATASGGSPGAWLIFSVTFLTA